METVSGSVDAPTMVSVASISGASGAGEPRLTAGQTWGPYRIGRLLGRGGMGEVYEAESLETGRRLALKLLRNRLEKADDRVRFLREGQLAASISAMQLKSPSNSVRIGPSFSLNTSQASSTVN